MYVAIGTPLLRVSRPAGREWGCQRFATVCMDGVEGAQISDGPAKEIAGSGMACGLLFTTPSWRGRTSTTSMRSSSARVKTSPTSARSGAIPTSRSTMASGLVWSVAPSVELPVPVEHWSSPACSWPARSSASPSPRCPADRRQPLSRCPPSRRPVWYRQFLLPRRPRRRRRSLRPHSRSPRRPPGRRRAPRSRSRPPRRPQSRRPGPRQRRPGALPLARPQSRAPDTARRSRSSPTEKRPSPRGCHLIACW